MEKVNIKFGTSVLNNVNTIKAVDASTPSLLHSFIIPSNTLTITNNGSYTVKTYEFATVNVPQPSGSTTITTNGSHNVKDYVTAEVNVPGIIPTGTITLTENGDHDVTNYATAKVDMMVPAGTLTITSNDTYDVTNYASATVNVPGIVPSGTKDIIANGEYDVTSFASASVAVPEPTGTKKITVNGSYDIKDFATVDVDVQGGVTPTGTKNITANGDHDVTTFATAHVAVPGIVPTGSVTYTENGTYDITNYAEVIINVSGGGGSRLSQPSTTLDKVNKALSWNPVTAAVKYAVYKDNELFEDEATSPVAITATGSYQVKAFGDGENYLNSLKSAAKAIAFYNVTLNGTNIKIDEATTQTYELVADTSGAVYRTCQVRAAAGYNVPDSLTISGIGYVYTKVDATHATLKIYDPTSTMTITIVGTEVVGEYDVTQSGSNLTVNKAPASQSSGTLTIN